MSDKDQETISKIVDFANLCGLKNAKVVDQNFFGYAMTGEGRDPISGNPLVWTVTELAGISHGCGSSHDHQINITKFDSKIANENLVKWKKEVSEFQKKAEEGSDKKHEAWLLLHKAFLKIQKAKNHVEDDVYEGIIDDIDDAIENLEKASRILNNENYYKDLK